MAHIIRSHHENTARQKVAVSLQRNQAMITADWKMKYLATYFRESQGEWFAKAGTIWHALMIVVKQISESRVSFKV